MRMVVMRRVVVEVLVSCKAVTLSLKFVVG